MQNKAERDAAMAASIPAEGDPSEILVELPDGRVLDFESRRGFGATSLKLAYESREGFHRHWFNDEPGRIEAARNAGYTPVKDREGREVSRVVDKTTGMKAYLHEVPQVWYEADIAVSQRAADEKDAAILAGAAPGANGQSEIVKNQYGSIKLSRREHRA